MNFFNDKSASLKRILIEGRLIESLIEDIIVRASRSPYDYKTGLADVEAIRAAANSQTAKRAMFSFHSPDSEQDEELAVSSMLDAWVTASRSVGPGRRLIGFPGAGGFGRVSAKVFRKVMRDAKLPPCLQYPVAYQKQENMIEAALIMAKYNLESVHQAIVALYIVASYFRGTGQGAGKTIEAEVNKLRDALWARARDFSRDEMMFTLVMQNEVENTSLRKTILKDTLGEGMSVMHFLATSGEMGSYEVAEDERFRAQLKAAAKTKRYQE